MCIRDRAAPNGRDDVNQLVQTWTPGAPLGLSAWEAGYADGTQDTVYLVQRYCRLSGCLLYTSRCV